MLESITPDSIFAEIMMDESSPGAFLLVEGPDENAIFFGHISNNIVLIVCGGKRNVIGAARLAESNAWSNVYGLIDKDFDEVLGLGVNYPRHVVSTESYDLVSDLIFSSSTVLRRTLSAHAALGVRDIEEAAGIPIDQVVFALTSRLAGVRLAAMRNGYPLTFKGFNFSTVVGATYQPAEIDSFLDHVNSRDPGFTLDASVRESVRDAFIEVDGKWHYSGGHDIVGASAAVLRMADSQVSGRTLSGTIISTASCAVLASLPCLRTLMQLASNDSDVDLFDCAAA